jgi:dTDP-4-amino-4,6-dideoxy-D-galactose acyltransferase
MSVPDPTLCEFLPWDTEFFGCRIARVCGGTLDLGRAAQIDDWSRRNRVRCLYFLSTSEDPATLASAEAQGFHLVDVRITLELRHCDSPAPAHSGPSVGAIIRQARPDDLVELQTIAKSAHRATRFYSDPHFPREKVEELYSTWIALEIQGRAQSVLVAARVTGRPVGYISCHLGPERRVGSIGLLGVSADARGGGVGRSLVQAATNWFRTQEAREVTVTTQGNNRAALRLYQKCGFISRDLQLWYHKWYPSLG